MSMTQSIKIVQPVLASANGFKQSYVNKEVNKTSESPRHKINYVQWQNPMAESSFINQSQSSISKLRESSLMQEGIQIDQINSFDRGSNLLGISEVLPSGVTKVGKQKQVEVLFYHQVKEFKKFLKQVEQLKSQ